MIVRTLTAAASFMLVSFDTIQIEKLFDRSVDLLSICSLSWFLAGFLQIFFLGLWHFRNRGDLKADEALEKRINLEDFSENSPALRKTPPCLLIHLLSGHKSQDL